MPIQNSLSSFAFEAQNETSHFKNVWFANIKNKSMSVFDSFIKNTYQIFTLMVLAYFLFLIFNIISYNFQFRTVKSFSTQYSTNPLEILESNLNKKQASIAKSLTENSQLQKLTETATLKTNLFKSEDSYHPSATPQLNLGIDQQEDLLSDSGIIQQKNIQENQAHMQTIILKSNLKVQQHQQNNQGKNQVIQTQLKQPLQRQISTVIAQKYGHILAEFNADENQIEKNNLNQQNMKLKAANGRSLQFLPDTQRQALIKNYLKNQVDPKSYYLQISTQNEILAEMESGMDRKIKTHLTKKYQMKNYQELNSLCVVVTTYNNANEHQILRTLNSIFNQQYLDYEVKIVDRFSTDHTESLIKNYVKDFPSFGEKIKFIRNKKASEVEATFQGLQYCQKNTIAILMNGNSQLLSRQVFKLIDHKYQTERIKVLYSDSYELDLSKKIITRSKCSSYDESQKFMNLYRDISRRYGSFLTFNTKLLKHLNETSLIDVFGSWFKYSSNEALKISLLELSCSKNIHLKQPFFLNQYESKLTQSEKKGQILQIQAISRKSKNNFC